jgi:hypothetical protein
MFNTRPLRAIPYLRGKQRLVRDNRPRVAERAKGRRPTARVQVHNDRLDGKHHARLHGDAHVVAALKVIAKVVDGRVGVELGADAVPGEGIHVAETAAVAALLMQ